MASGPTSFVITSADRSRVVDTLIDLGFRFEEPSSGSMTLLDTFDGRLHRAGLRLVLHDAHRPELVLTGDGIVAASVEPSKPVRFAGDLPRGPFRSRIEEITDGRVLLPQLQITATTTAAVCRDDEGRFVANVVLVEQIAAVGAPVASIDTPLPEAVVEVHDVVGSRKPARRAAEALEAHGLESVDGDAIAVLARAARVDLDGFSASATVPLDPDMPAAEGVRDVLANLADTIDANWQGTIDHLDPEFLHDLRIAVRRTRAVISQTNKALPPDVVDEALEGFAWLGGLTGPARDLDVYLIEWDDYVRPLGAAVSAELAPVRELLEQRQAHAHAALDEAMRSPAADRLMATWRRHLVEIPLHESPGEHAGRALGRVVRQRMTRAQTRLVERGRLINPATPAEQVHDLRKDAKKLRYLLECFSTLLADGPRKQFVKRLKALQDNLGAHQDAEVHVALIREIAAELHDGAATADTLLALGQLTERLEQIRVATRTEFAEQFASYDTAATAHAFAAMLDFLDS